jgi:hypothetical protein
MVFRKRFVRISVRTPTILTDFLEVFLNPSRNMLEEYLKFVYNRLLLHFIQFIIQYHPIIHRYTFQITDIVVK